MQRAIRDASDYNRGLAPVVRWAHVLLAPLLAWLFAQPRRQWTLPLALGLLLVVLLVPFDGPLLTAVERLGIGGDLRRELGAWQQFGALGSLLFTAAAIWLGDPARRRRLLDLVAAVAVGWSACSVLKVIVGRPRPRPEYRDPHTFLWPWGQYPVEVADGQLVLMHGWDPRIAQTADLWSMPSGHTAHAAVLAVFIAALYPRLRPLMWVMIAIVGFSRLVFGAHWPTDVIAGAAVGIAAGRVATERYWGVRALDWFWKRWIDRGCSPALPRVLEAERARRTLPDPAAAAVPPPAAAAHGPGQRA
jgi:membrane-associated phospholipid phosphatase